MDDFSSVDKKDAGQKVLKCNTFWPVTPLVFLNAILNLANSLFVRILVYCRKTSRF